MAVNKKELVQRAKLAEQAVRYDDMAAAMKSVVETGMKLSTLLCDAYTNLERARLSSWRVISSIVEKKEGSEREQEMALEYREKVAKELRESCEEVLFLIPKAFKAESEVFYLKMKGDYYRYMAEVATGDARKAVVEESQKAYQEGLDISKVKLAPTEPIRLGIALNFSVFYYEILSSLDQARNLAKKAFQEAKPTLNDLDGDAYKDTAVVMQLLRDNLSFWTEW